MFRSGTYNRFRPFPDARLIHDNRACVPSKEQRLAVFIPTTSPTFPALQRATRVEPLAPTSEHRGGVVCGPLDWGGRGRLHLLSSPLGVEGLEQFVRGEPQRRVHECDYGALALESEPVDPRLYLRLNNLTRPPTLYQLNRNTNCLSLSTQVPGSL
jgi:PNKP adenylyltransferase domain, C-terminal region